MPSIINATTSTGLVSSADNSGSLQLATNNGTTALTIDTSQNVGIGTTSPVYKLHVNTTFDHIHMTNPTTGTTGSDGFTLDAFGTSARLIQRESAPMEFYTAGTERMRIDSSGNAYIGKTSASTSTTGYEFNTGVSAYSVFTNTRTDGVGDLLIINRQGSDGKLVGFSQADTQEGDISVSGTTVSYNGGHLSRYAQTIEPKDDSLLKGTVLSNLDEMNEYSDAESNPVPNEQLNKVKISDIEGDVNIAGVFVNWSHDETHNVDEINMAMTGDMIIRIAEGVVVQKGDLLMSAGDGTAKPQGDDIRRSKTVAKVTSNYVTCTYADGSYCVPCVLMAC